MLLALLASTAWADWTGSGTKDDPYQIKTTADLDELAQRVNETYEFPGDAYFRLCADISYSHATDWDQSESTENNFTPIGDDREFSGHFDGGGHTISGIRIYSENSHRGLFGEINGSVRNVILADARIVGGNDVGGIVGDNVGVVENCYVADDVYIGTISSDYENIGGIVGYLSSSESSVIGCVSSATIVGWRNCGGIVGYARFPSSVSYCCAIGVKISCLNGSLGAIVGAIDDFDHMLSHNYYYNCVANDENNNIGCLGYDPDLNDGAVRVNQFPLLDGYSNDLLFSIYLKDINDGVTLAGRTLYKDGSWNTLCLPFDIYSRSLMSDLYSPSSIMELKETTFVDGRLTLIFQPVDLNGDSEGSVMKAGKPYLIRWNRADDYQDNKEYDLVNPELSFTTVGNLSRTETEFADFCGTFGAVDFPETDRRVLFLGKDDKLYYPEAGATIGAFRGFFRLKGLRIGDPSDPSNPGDEATTVKEFALDYDMNVGTSLTSPTPVRGSDDIYNLSGQKLRHINKGINIVNGSKILK